MARIRSRGKDAAWADGNRAARALGTGIDDYYICPLCVHGFTRAQLTDLTWDHVPPKSLGGRLKVLTCRDCNSRAGHEIDVHAKREAESQVFVRGKSTGERRARFVVGDVTANVSVGIHNSGWRISGLPKRNHPDTLPALYNVFDNHYREGRGFPASTISFRFDFIARRAGVSWLRSAYLAAFAVYGYRYALRKVMDIVRNQVANPDDEIIRRSSVRLTNVTVAADGVIRLTEPTWAEGVGVKMGEVFVFLPLRDDDSDFYERLAREGVNGRQVNIRGDGYTLPTGPVYSLDQAPMAN